MHFTYDLDINRGELSQGDVLERTPEVNAVLEEVHPHYHRKTEYHHFLILTQSCDLVRRGKGGCKSPYITIAAVRDAKEVVRKELKRYQNHRLEQELGFCDLARKSKLDQFVERLLNNNQSTYFFLKAAPDANLDQDSCAVLHLSIAVRVQHYDSLLAAKRLQLRETFQHKLGYLVGNLYSRVGTEDWTPHHYRDEEFKQAVESYANDPDLVEWLETAHHREVMKRLKKLQNPTLQDFASVYAEVKKERDERRRVHLDTIAEKIGIHANVSPPTMEKIRRALENDPRFRSQVK